jgi:hypothetical protein
MMLLLAADEPSRLPVAISNSPPVRECVSATEIKRKKGGQREEESESVREPEGEGEQERR